MPGPGNDRAIGLRTDTAPVRVDGREARLVRSVEEQQARITAAAVAPRPMRVAIAEAQGLLCAEEVVTERPLPGFDQAAIDGYAVRSVDVLGIGEVGGDTAFDETGEPLADEDNPGGLVLPVMGTIEAGARTPSRLQPRQAVRVHTGAPLPTLADAVLPLRWTDGGTSKVRILRGAPSGAYVRRAGDDVQPGDVAVRAGTIIGAAQVGLLAAVGRERVAGAPTSAGGDPGGGRRAGRYLADAEQRAGLRRQLLRIGSRRPGCRRGGQPGRHRLQQP